MRPVYPQLNLEAGPRGKDSASSTGGAGCCLHSLLRGTDADCQFTVPTSAIAPCGQGWAPFILGKPSQHTGPERATRACWINNSHSAPSILAFPQLLAQNRMHLKAPIPISFALWSNIYQGPAMGQTWEKHLHMHCLKMIPRSHELWNKKLWAEKRMQLKHTILFLKVL